MQTWLYKILAMPEVVSGLIALVFMVIGEGIKRWIQPKSRVVWSPHHAFNFSLPSRAEGESPLIVCTGAVWVQNVGRSAARNVEVHFEERPQHFEVWPVRQYKDSDNPTGHFSISTPDLAPREFFTIQLMSTNYRIPPVANVRWDQGVGKNIVMGPMQIFPMWRYRMVIGLVVIGLFAIVYGIVRGLLFLAN